MNIALMLLAVSSLILPGIATGHALARVAAATDSIPYATTLPAASVATSTWK